ncbi:MAG: hypothetical protein LBE13_06285 [Bacteroidales bacterium]|jgi:hypothetical protein|nr:hypothetical protein [Bacteroidales bacterium]
MANDDPPRVQMGVPPYKIEEKDKTLSLFANDNYYGEMFGYTILQSYYTDDNSNENKIKRNLSYDIEGVYQHIKHTLQLPLPSDLQDMFNAKWSSSPFDKIVENAIKVEMGTQDYKNNFAGFDLWTSNMNNFIENSFSSLTKSIGDAINRQLGGSEANIEHVQQRMWGGATNNNDSIFFEGHSIDSFTLSFDIIPLNKDYYEAVTRILKAMILDASADLSLGESYWSIPGNFSIRIYVPNGTSEPTLFYQRDFFKIKSINTNFNNSGSMTFHKNGELVKFNVKLECMDTAMISKTKRRDFVLFGSGYDSVDTLSKAEGGSTKTGWNNVPGAL